MDLGIKGKAAIVTVVASGVGRANFNSAGE